MIEITNFEDEQLDIYARLNEAQLAHIYEPKPGLFIAESPKVIERALAAGCEPVSLLVETKHIEGEAKEIVIRLEAQSVPIYTASFDVLSKLTGYKLTRGALCAMKRPELPSAEELLANCRRVAILEDVVNPTNVGAIFRSAAALGMDAVLLTKACSDPLYRRAERVGMGTMFQVPWTYLEGDLDGAGTELLHRCGFKTVAMALREDSFAVDDPVFKETEKLAVVLGTEGEGLRDGSISACDYTVMIPMTHGVDSLNVAAASAVAFWELGRRN